MRYAYAYVMGRVALVQRDALVRGKLVHRFLEAWLPARDKSEAAVTAAVETMRTDAQGYGMDTEGHEWTLLEIVARSYALVYADSFAEHAAFHVEQPFTIALSDDIDFVGRIDAITTMIDGKTWIVEHKTTQAKIDPTSRYWERLALDAQISAYYLGARSLGFDIIGCIYDVIRIPPIKPLLATPMEKRRYKRNGELYANQREQDEPVKEYGLRVIEEMPPGEWFARRNYVRLESELIRSQRNLFAAAELVQLIRHNMETKGVDAILQNDRGCHQFGVCEYWDVCNGAASIHDDLRFVDKRKNASDTIEIRESEPWEDDYAF